MGTEEIQASLASLQREVESLDAADSATRERLTQLIADVQKQLDSDDENEPAGSTSDHVASLIEQFEVEHPRITETLNRILTILGESGI